MSDNSRVAFVDTSVFIGLVYDEDTHHKKASVLFEEKIKKGYQFITSSAVIDETATVLSSKIDQNTARQFLDFSESLKTCFFSEEFRRETHRLFKKQHKKGTSMVDCSIIVMMRKMKINEIMTFDTWLSKQVAS